MLATRVKAIQPSGIRRIFDIAVANPDGIDLSIGDPDFDIPEPIKEEGMRWIRKGFNRYVSTRGIPDLRAALQAYLSERDVNFEDVLITAGATGGYFLAMMSIVSPGDEVLIGDPYFVAYANVVIMCGGVPKFIDTYPDFSLRRESILPLITERTKAIVVNNPNNPTGVVYSREEIQLVDEIATEHGLHIISDEIYEKFVYGEKPFISVGTVAEDALVIGGFSKSAGMTGWRLGYAAGPKHLIDAMATYQQYSYVCANSIAQKAAIQALNYDMASHVARFAARRERFYEGLKSHFRMSPSSGAFYLFPEAPGRNADRFVDAAIARGVFVIPGNVFSQRNSHFRLSFAVPDAKIDNAIKILCDLAEELGTHSTRDSRRTSLS